MYHFEAPPIPAEVNELPPVLTGEVYSQRGHLIDISSMKFSTAADGIPVQIELLRQTGGFEPTTIYNLSPEKLLETYKSNCRDAHVFVPSRGGW